MSCFFIGTDLDKLLAHQWLLCNEWVPSEWESKFTCQLFSCLDSRSDGTHSLQRIQWWVCNAKFLFWWRNKLILDGLSISQCSSLNVNIYPGCWHVCNLAEQIMEFCKRNSEFCCFCPNVNFNGMQQKRCKTLDLQKQDCVLLKFNVILFPSGPTRTITSTPACMSRSSRYLSSSRVPMAAPHSSCLRESLEARG